MIIRTLNANNLQTKTVYISPSPLKNTQIISHKKQTFQSYHVPTQTSRISKTNITPHQPSIYIKSPSKDQRIKLITFQNEYIKQLTKKQCIVDQRKLLLKQKIKGKVKQQLADLLKRSDFMSSSQVDIKIKDEVMSKTVLEVEVKGSTVQKSLRNSVSHRPQLVKLQKIRKVNKKQIHLLKEAKPIELNSQRMLTADSSPREKTKNRRSLSNVIKLHNITPRRFTRNVHSALEGIHVMEKKESVQIQPWQYAQDY